MGRVRVAYKFYKELLCPLGTSYYQSAEESGRSCRKDFFDSVPDIIKYLIFQGGVSCRNEFIGRRCSKADLVVTYLILHVISVIPDIFGGKCGLYDGL